MKKLVFLLSIIINFAAFAAIDTNDFLSFDIMLESHSQELAPENWQNLSIESHGVAGTGVEQVYSSFTVPDHKIIVAIIDGGVDINHEELQGKIWINEDEIPNNGIDDDGNGYIDDYTGWNFIGSAQGMGKVKNTENPNGFIFESADPALQVQCDNKASTRELSYLLRLEKNNLLSETQALKLIELKKQIIPKQEEAIKYLTKYQAYQSKFAANIAYLQKLGLKELTLESLASLNVDLNDPKQMQIKAEVYEQLRSGITPEKLQNTIAEYTEEAYCFYNYQEDPRSKIVGDDPYNLDEKYYGNNDVIGPNPNHGTAAAGVIGANRDNAIGINGISQSALIMPIRILAKGDERDKDVANAIYYAVDNGARIINISFGKYSSLHKHAVDKAVAYAEDKNVLIVNSAGNESSDNDQIIHYPNDLSLSGERFSNMITVASSDAKIGNHLVPRFSNYGQSSVDLLAPGVMIHTLAINNSYTYSSGTSLSAPIVSGIAALLLTFKPELTIHQIKDYLLQTVTRLPGQTIFRNQTFYLTDLCRSGGIVNAFAAVQALLNGQVNHSLASN